MSEFPSKYSPAQLMPTVFPLLVGTVLARFFCDMAFSSFVALALISEIVLNLLDLRVFFSFGNKKKSQGESQVSRVGGGGEEQ